MDLFFDSVVPSFLLLALAVAVYVIFESDEWRWRRLFAIVAALGSLFGAWVRWPGELVRDLVSLLTDPVMDHPLMSALFALAVAFLVAELVRHAKS